MSPPSGCSVPVVCAGLYDAINRLFVGVAVTSRHMILPHHDMFQPGVRSLSHERMCFKLVVLQCVLELGCRRARALTGWPL